MILKNPQPNFPSLSESPLLRYFSFITLYFSQGIPEGITLFAIPAWLAMNGKSAGVIAGYSAIVMIPFSLKILLAPIIEKFTYLPMGRRKPWLLLGQFGILCSIIGLSFVQKPLDNIHHITYVALCIHVFIMFQDIATDSLVIDIVPIEQQGKANSMMWGSKTIGASTSLFVGSWLINQYGFSTAILTMSVFVLLIMIFVLFFKERKGEKLFPWTKGTTSPDAELLHVDSWKKLFKSFKQVIILRNSLFLLVSIFIVMAALYYLRTLLPIFTIQELGWNNVYYSKVLSTSNLAGGIGGMLIGAFVIQRYGVIRLIQVGLLLLILLAGILAFASVYWKYNTFLIAFIAIFCVLLTLVNIGVLALSMQLCWRRISAIQFTFCMTIFNTGMSVGAALFGYLRSYFDWQVLILVFTFLIFVSMIIVRLIKTKKHTEQVDHLENNYLEILHKESALLTKSEVG